MADQHDRLADVVEPVVEAHDAALYDLEHRSGVVRVLVEREGGIDLDAIAGLSRALSRALDEADPISGRYTLEVSSPGLERPLRTAEHFRRAVGDEVTVRLRTPVDGARRVRGVLVSAGDDSFEVAPEDGDTARTVRIADVQKARTIFTWERGEPRSESTKRKAET